MSLESKIEDMILAARLRLYDSIYGRLKLTSPTKHEIVTDNSGTYFCTKVYYNERNIQKL